LWFGGRRSINDDCDGEIDDRRVTGWWVESKIEKERRRY